MGTVNKKSVQLNSNLQYSNLIKAWTAAFRDKKKGDVIQQEYNNFWAENRGNEDEIRRKCAELWTISAQNKKSPLLALFAKMKSIANEPKSQPNSETEFYDNTELSKDPEILSSQESNEIMQIDEMGDEDADLHLPEKVKKSAHAQEKMENEIKAVNKIIADLSILRGGPYITPEQESILSKNIKDKKELELQLKRLKDNSKRQTKLREKRKRNFEKLKDEDPDVAKKLTGVVSTRSGRGRPSLNESYPELLAKIKQLVSHGGAADNRRSTFGHV